MKVSDFSNLLTQANKSEKDLLQEFISEDSNGGQNNYPQAQNINEGSSIEARAKDLKLDQIVQITQQLSDGTVKKFKFKIIEIWPTPTNFFTVVSLNKPHDQLNYWTLFYEGTYYLKKANKSLINVHVKLV